MKHISSSHAMTLLPRRPSRRRARRLEAEYGRAASGSQLAGGLPHPGSCGFVSHDSRPRIRKFAVRSQVSRAVAAAAHPARISPRSAPSVWKQREPASSDFAPRQRRHLEPIARSMAPFRLASRKLLRSCFDSTALQRITQTPLERGRRSE